MRQARTEGRPFVRHGGRWRSVLRAGIVLALASGVSSGDETVPAGGHSTGGEDVSDFNLTRLAALEQQNGNGGAGEGQPILAAYDPKNGFHIRDAEDNFRLRLTGRLQARYTYKGMSVRGADPASTGRDVSGFELERARLGMRGHLFSPRFAFKIEIDSDTDSSDKGTLRDAYILIKEVLGKGNRLLNIGAGQWKPGFLRQEKTSSGRLQFVDRSLMTEMFNVDRNIGIWATGAADALEYEVGLTNGFDSVNEGLDEIDQIPAVILRVDYNILRDGDRNMKFEESDFRMAESPAWVVGAAFATDQNNGTASAGGQDEFKVYQVEIDTAFKYLGFSLQSEYAARWLETVNPAGALAAGSNSVFMHGFYVQSGYFILPDHGVEIGARGSVVWSEGSQNGTADEAGPTLNWFVTRDHRVKFQLDVHYVDIPSHMQPPTERLVDDSGFSDRLGSGSTNLMAGDQGVIARAQVQFSW